MIRLGKGKEGSGKGNKLRKREANGLLMGKENEAMKLRTRNKYG
jgi:hypothetical protein